MSIPPATTSPFVRWSRPINDDTTALVVALHGRGADETTLDFLPELVPANAAVAAVRAPIAEGAGWAWFANRGIGRPTPASLARSIELLATWLATGPAIPTYLFGFSGGTAMAGGLFLDSPRRFQGAALLSGTLPFDAGVSTAPDRLAGLPVFYSRGAEDHVIPAELFARSEAYLAEESGAELTLRVYDGLGHGLDQRTANDLAAWFAAVIVGDASSGVTS